MSSKKETIHVTKKDGKWSSKKANAKKASKTFDTKKEAVEYAKAQAKKIGNAEVKIHGKDGKIQESNTYTRQNDPRNIKG